MRLLFFLKTFQKDFTKDQADGLLYRGLVGELALQELGREEVAELGGLVPSNMLVVNIHHTKPTQKEQYVLDYTSTDNSCLLFPTDNSCLLSPTDNSC